MNKAQAKKVVLLNLALWFVAMLLHLLIRILPAGSGSLRRSLSFSFPFSLSFSLAAPTISSWPRLENRRTTEAAIKAVNALVMTMSDPPTVGEVQAIAIKLDELILVLRR